MMSNIIETVLLSLTLVLSIVAYAAIMSRILPEFVLRVSYNFTPLLGRGLKKFTYPDGRAVVYEAQPSVRKYVERYALFTLDGFKYLQLMLGSGVLDYSATVLMIDNRNKVIDTLAVSEVTGGAIKSRQIRLHDRTSYVAISVSRVNGSGLAEPKYAYTKLIWIAAYFVLAATASFMLFWHMHYTASEIFRIFGGVMPGRIGLSFFVAPSLLIGASTLGVLLGSRMKKGIRVGLK